jgi:hypothetical protein
MEGLFIALTKGTAGGQCTDAVLQNQTVVYVHHSHRHDPLYTCKLYVIFSWHTHCCCRQ